jgi:hypothetical protein
MWYMIGMGRLILSLFLMLTVNVFSQLEDLRLIIPIGHTDDIMLIELSNRGELIATSGSVMSHYGGSTFDFAADRNVIIWNKRGIPLHSLTHASEIMYIGGFSYDDALLLTSDVENVYLWDVASGALTFKVPLSMMIGDDPEFGFKDSSYTFFFRTGFNEIVYVDYTTNDPVKNSRIRKVESELEIDFGDQNEELFLDDSDSIILVRTDDLDALSAENDLAIDDTLAAEVSGELGDSTNMIEEYKLVRYAPLNRKDTLIQLYGAKLKHLDPESYYGTLLENESHVIYHYNNELLVFDKQVKKLFEGKNRSATIDFANFSISEQGFYYDNANFLHFMDLVSFEMNSIKYNKSLWFKKFFYMDSTVLIADFECPFVMNHETGEELYFDTLTIGKERLEEVRYDEDTYAEIGLADILGCQEKWGVIYGVEKRGNQYKLLLCHPFKDENVCVFQNIDGRLFLDSIYVEEWTDTDSIGSYTYALTSVEDSDSLTAVEDDELTRSSLSASSIGERKDVKAIKKTEKEITVSWGDQIVNLLLNKPLNTGGGFDRAAAPDQVWVDVIRNFIAVNELYQLEFFDLTGKALMRFIPIDTNGFLFVLPSGHYALSNPSLSKELYYYKSNTELLHFDQLDPIYNRPDLVLERIGQVFNMDNTLLVEQYRKAWEKRIEKLELDPAMLGSRTSVPLVETIISKENLNLLNGNLPIKIKASDSLFNLINFNLYVNEVPVYGSQGISISNKTTQNWDTTIVVPLSLGENKIQVSVMNELGLENFKYPTYVSYIPEQAPASKTIFIGIGVDEFRNEQITDLRYCVKDVRDLGSQLKKSNSVDTVLLINEHVTKKAVLQLKERLMQTTVHDQVIISCSSHGLLDQENNFYLAMHDTDPAHPAINGLAYDELSSLLDGIPARQKILFLDACNSGENDMSSLQSTVKRNGTVNQDARGGETESTTSTEKSSFETMMELFVNISNPTGAVVISAAGGQQSALEAVTVDNTKIENGAFTYSVLEFLKANADQSEQLTVNKLKQYVESRVVDITNGKQRPTSRQETMEVDWRIR